MQETVKVMPTLPTGLACRQKFQSTIEVNSRRVVNGILIPVNKISAEFMNHTVIQVVSSEFRLTKN